MTLNGWQRWLLGGAVLIATLLIEALREAVYRRRRGRRG